MLRSVAIENVESCERATSLCSCSTHSAIGNAQQGTVSETHSQENSEMIQKSKRDDPRDAKRAYRYALVCPAISAGLEPGMHG